jgi:hypothetical protein
MRCVYLRCELGERTALRLIRNAARAPKPAITWSEEIVDGQMTPVIPINTNQKRGYITSDGEFVVRYRKGELRRTGQKLTKQNLDELRPDIEQGLKRLKPAPGS